MKKKKPLPTIWEVSDELWQRMEPLILELDPPKETGRPRANPRNIVDAIIFRIRTGCHANGIKFHVCMEMIRPFTEHFSIGLNWVCSRRFGHCWSKSVMPWVWWTGIGKRQMGRWARRAWVGMKLAPTLPTEAKMVLKRVF